MEIIVFVTVPESDAQQLAKIILQKKLAACVSILPKVESYFWWDGKIDFSKEVLLMIKTKKDLFVLLEEIIKKNHPYDMPEIIAVDICAGNKEYLCWIEEPLED
jgi:periplasmic divalent cation tolerance protein